VAGHPFTVGGALPTGTGSSDAVSLPPYDKAPSTGQWLRLDVASVKRVP
jgi:hypothetical protein